MVYVSDLWGLQRGTEIPGRCRDTIITPRTVRFDGDLADDISELEYTTILPLSKEERRDPYDDRPPHPTVLHKILAAIKRL